MRLALEIMQACWTTLCAMAPYLLLGFFLAGVLSVIIPVRWVKVHLSSHRRASFVKAALFGIPLPLCSCGVLPVATWMRRHGASKGATGSFLLATPQTGVDGFLVAVSLLGIGFAFFIPIAAFVAGVCLGFLLNRFPERGEFELPEDNEAAERPSILLRVLKHGFGTVAADIAVALLVGVFLAGLLSVFIDEQQFSDLGSSLGAKLFVIACATPLYVCATASIPVGATMLAAGLSPGTVFVFLMAGPATNAATFTTISRLLGKTEGLIYLVGAVKLALLFGILLDALPLAGMVSGMIPHHHHEELGWFDQMAGLLLLLILLGAKVSKRRERRCR